MASGRFTKSSSSRSKRQEYCVICRETDERNNLVVVCTTCHKKSDEVGGFRAHRACLTRAIAANDADEPLKCAQCRRPYSIDVRYNFKLSFDRCMSFDSMGHAFEFVMVLMMLVCVVFTMHNFVTHVTDRELKESPTARYIVFAMFGVVICLIPMTARKVFGRWSKANSTTEISLV